MRAPIFQPRPDPHPLIEEALELAIKRSTASKRYPVHDGRLVYEQHRRYRYAYKLASVWDVADGTELQLHSHDVDGLPVQLSNTKDDLATIVTTQRLPDSTLQHAHLVVDRAYLLRKLKDALDPRTVSPTSAQLGLKVFGHLDCLDATASPQCIETLKEFFRPDEAQRLAILRALESEVLMILGPPGTGKTDVLAAIALLHALLYQHRVLISSHTNIAIDNAIIRLVGFLREKGLEHWLDDQAVVRYGDPHMAMLETEEYRHVSIPLIVADSIQQQREEMGHLERRRDLLLQQLTINEAHVLKERKAWEQRKAGIPQERKQAMKDLRTLEEEERLELTPLQETITELQEQARQAQQAMERARAEWNAAETRRQPLAQAYAAQQQQRGATTKKLKELDTYQPLKRFWVQFTTNEWQQALHARVEDLTISLHALEAQILPIQQRQTAIKASYQTGEQHHKGLQKRITTWTTKYDKRATFFQEKKAALLQKIKELDQEIQTGNARIIQGEKALEQGRQERALIEDSLAHLDQQVSDAKREASRKAVEAAQIVGATLTGLFMNPVLLHQEWDVVIVDEGSMAPPPAVLLAANRARAHLIVVGDPLQLAPVCTFQEAQLKHWLGRDIFHHGGYTLEQAATATHHSALLPYQGRMAPPICDLVRGTIYKGRLKDRNPQRPLPAFDPEPEHPVVLYDTGDAARARAERPKNGSSRFNTYHAQISVRLAQMVLASMPKEDLKLECVGIVTPYAAQREVIKDLLRGTEVEILTRVGTVHAFQGLEFDALIFDTVESPGLEIAPFLRGGWGSDAMRLLNVAITRAKYKLLLVANLPYIQREPATFILPQMLQLGSQKRRVRATTLLT